VPLAPVVARTVDTPPLKKHPDWSTIRKTPTHTSSIG
jgi:hypothetical protein